MLSEGRYLLSVQSDSYGYGFEKQSGCAGAKVQRREVLFIFVHLTAFVFRSKEW